MAVHRWFDVTVDAHVDLPGGRRYKAPVSIGTAERFSFRDLSLRDKDGRLVLPAISVTRTGLDPTNSMLALGSNVPRLQISRRVAPKTEPLVGNRLARDPLLSEGPRPIVYEVTTIPFPFNGTATYEVKVYAQYVGHVNAIIERIMAELEFFDVPSFVIPLVGHGLPTGAGPTPGEQLGEEELPYDHRVGTDQDYVVGYFDSALTSEGNTKDFTEQERVIEWSGQFTVPVFLQLNPPDKREAVQVEYTAFRVGFGDERSHFPDDEGELELLLSGGKISEKVRRR